MCIYIYIYIYTFTQMYMLYVYVYVNVFIYIYIYYTRVLSCVILKLSPGPYHIMGLRGKHLASAPVRVRRF